jgi:hypothetical protein
MSEIKKKNSANYATFLATVVAMCSSLVSVIGELHDREMLLTSF